MGPWRGAENAMTTQAPNPKRRDQGEESLAETGGGYNTP